MYARCCYLTFSILLIFSITACRKNAQDPQTPAAPQIDVATQWQIDIDGYPLFIPDSSQWAEKTFTEAEMNLFTPLDTASLSGTAMPDSFRKINNYTYPNPFHSIHVLDLKFNSEFEGNVVLKYVVVDQHLTVLRGVAARLTNGKSHIGVKPDLPAGKYRLYYTLSTEGHPHFYKSWGNIESYE